MIDVQVRSWIRIGEVAKLLEINVESARKVVLRAGVRVQRLPGHHYARFNKEDVIRLMTESVSIGQAVNRPEGVAWSA